MVHNPLDIHYLNDNGNMTLSHIVRKVWHRYGTGMVRYGLGMDDLV